KCPEPVGAFQYSPDCSKYVQCDNKEPTVMKCSDGLEFNPKKSYCDWPRPEPYPGCERTTQI
ncbi:carbohydrate-binding module family 14 protein, partial [Biomphalaria glabrata]